MGDAHRPGSWNRPRTRRGGGAEGHRSGQSDSGRRLTDAARGGCRRQTRIQGDKGLNAPDRATEIKLLNGTIARYDRVDLRCIDELGDVKLDRRGVELLVRVLTERDEKNGVAIASNAFSGWTKTFTDPRLCAAIVDRLTFGANIIGSGCDSYRLADACRRRQNSAA